MFLWRHSKHNWVSNYFNSYSISGIFPWLFQLSGYLVQSWPQPLARDPRVSQTPPAVVNNLIIWILNENDIYSWQIVNLNSPRVCYVFIRTVWFVHVFAMFSCETLECLDILVKTYQKRYKFQLFSLLSNKSNLSLNIPSPQSFGAILATTRGQRTPELPRHTQLLQIVR